MPGRNDGCAVIAVAYLEANRGIATATSNVIGSTPCTTAFETSSDTHQRGLS
jgi:hypothetical protein